MHTLQNKDNLYTIMKANTELISNCLEELNQLSGLNKLNIDSKKDNKTKNIKQILQATENLNCFCQLFEQH